MKISQEVREFARLNPATTSLAKTPGVIAIQPATADVSAGYEEKAQEFRERGSEIYL